MLCSEAPHEFRDLTNLSLLIRPRQFPVQRRALCLGHQPRQLHQPGRRKRTHELYEFRMVATQSTKCLEHGQIRLARTELLDALTADDDDARQLADELLDERCLADSCSARDPEHGALAADDIAPRGMQLRE